MKQHRSATLIFPGMADEWAAAVKAAVPGHAEVVDALIGWIAHAFQLESRPDPSHSADGSSTVAEGGASGLTGPTGPIYPPPPIGALLVGPTGVGKTALASALLETSPVTAIFLEAEAAYRFVLAAAPFACSFCLERTHALSKQLPDSTACSPSHFASAQVRIADQIH